MAKKVRLVSVQLILSAVIDDGEHLTPIQVDPVFLAPAQFATLEPDSLLADLQAQVDHGEADEPSDS